MQDGGRIQAAIEVLDDVLARRRPVADVLKDWGLSHRFAGSGDRSAIGNLVHDALRRRLSLAHRMGDDAARALAIGAYAFSWGADVDRIDAVFAADRHAPDALTGRERAAISSGRLDDAPGFVRADVPEWLWPAFSEAFGDDAVVEGAALAARAPVDLRVNALKATRDKVLLSLKRFDPEPTPLSPHGIRIAAPAGPKRAPYLQGEPGFAKGWFDIQDEASQVAALLAGGYGGAQIVDYCAGAGGKTLALAAEMGNSGQIYAFDADRRRFGDIRDRLKRAGVRNVQIRPPDGADPLADLRDRADVVLVDAPCTGVGTWRRRPDAKWRMAPGALEIRRKEQAAVLDAAMALVRPGGHLVYATCSLLAAENQDRIAGFVGENPSFGLCDPAEAWLAALGAAMPEHVATDVAGFGRAVRLSPASTGTDGFFIALMRRNTP